MILQDIDTTAYHISSMDGMRRERISRQSGDLLPVLYAAELS